MVGRGRSRPEPAYGWPVTPEATAIVFAGPGQRLAIVVLAWAASLCIMQDSRWSTVPCEKRRKRTYAKVRSNRIFLFKREIEVRNCTNRELWRIIQRFSIIIF